VGDVSFFNSSIDTTPCRTLATLSAFDKSKTVLILGGQDKGLSYECLGEPLKNLRGAVLFGQSKNKILPHIKCKAFVVNTLKEAVLCAFSIARAGDNIVLSPSCASFDMFENYQARGTEFCKIVNEIC
jgi:UDP-N-acetylmuramoylalanine--D-glutamate ligase